MWEASLEKSKTTRLGIRVCDILKLPAEAVGPASVAGAGGFLVLTPACNPLRFASHGGLLLSALSRLTHVLVLKALPDSAGSFL
jgi:hypothetical protein